MKNFKKLLMLMICTVLLLSGCTVYTLDNLYSPPKRSKEHQELQTAIDQAMPNLEYSAPKYGENQQTVQVADLDGDGVSEYLLFAKGSGEKPLQILVFREENDSYRLVESIDSYGASFDQVEYVSVDDKPGCELVVGMQLSDQVLRSVSVYSFATGQSQLLMNANYTKFITCDLDSDQCTELLILRPGETPEQNGIAEYYSYSNGIMERSMETAMSRPVDYVKRIMVSKLETKVPAVYVASLVDENSLITDVFSVIGGNFVNIGLSDETGNSVQTMRNYYVYADDIDDDGIMELPELITMDNYIDRTGTHDVQYLIRWYSLKPNGQKIDKLYTYHNFDRGWYLELEGEWAPRIWVTQNEGVYSFYLWNEDFTSPKKMMTLYAFTGHDREEKATTSPCFPVYRTDTVVYACQVEIAFEGYSDLQQKVIDSFHLIRMDWKSGET